MTEEVDTDFLLLRLMKESKIYSRVRRIVEMAIIAEWYQIYNEDKKYANLVKATQWAKMQHELRLLCNEIRQTLPLYCDLQGHTINTSS